MDSEILVLMRHLRLLSLVLLGFTTQHLVANPPSSGRFTLQKASELIDAGNPLFIEGYLRAWSATSPREIDLYVAKFNVDFQRFQKTGSDSLYSRSLSHLNSAVGMQPRRLDLWLKTIYALNTRGYHADQSNLMVVLLDASDRFEHQWLWEGDVPLEESEAVFLMTMHDHLEQWIGLAQPPVAQIRRVAGRIHASFPLDGASRAAVGLSHLIEGQPALGVPHLKRATELEPSNGSVWLMLAEAYQAVNDIPASVDAYQAVTRFGNEEQREVAASELERLR